MKKLILAGLLSVGVMFANGDEMCISSETCWAFKMELAKFAFLYAENRNKNTESATKQLDEQINKICSAFMDLTPNDIKILRENGLIEDDDMLIKKCPYLD